jgi:hypothetical protein
MRFGYQTSVEPIGPTGRAGLGPWVVSLGLLSALFPPTLAAAEYSYRTNAAGDLVLSLSGPITATDGTVFLNAVNNLEPQVVELEGPGGDMLSAARIGIIIHERSLATHAVGTCRSACAYIWIAGASMLANEGVTIDNHLPVSIQADVPDDQHLAIFGWYLGKLDLSVEMMDAFLNLATGYGTASNRYFDMLAFARYWNAPVRIVPAGLPLAERVSQID